MDDSPAPPPDSRDALPDILAGPLLRRLEPGRVVLWLAASRTLDFTLTLYPADERPIEIALDATRCQQLRVGRHAFIVLIDVSLEAPLPSDTLIGYDLAISARGGQHGVTGIADWAPHLLYPGQQRPAFVIKSRIDALLHGSCRRPHHPGKDGLARADAWLAPHQDRAEARPALLMLSGDQIYADDVAGPMLVAIHALIARLGLVGESLEGAVVAGSDELYAATDTYYHRERLLPEFEANEALRERFFGGVRKPIFTTASAANHLITFAEVLAMYLLVYSPVPWRLIAPTAPALSDEDAARYADEADDHRGVRRGVAGSRPGHGPVTDTDDLRRS